MLLQLSSSLVCLSRADSKADMDSTRYHKSDEGDQTEGEPKDLIDMDLHVVDVDNQSLAGRRFWPLHLLDASFACP